MDYCLLKYSVVSYDQHVSFVALIFSLKDFGFIILFLMQTRTIKVAIDLVFSFAFLLKNVKKMLTEEFVDGNDHAAGRH
jgi:hypothetical protein